MWGVSSAGRAPVLHAGGQEFDPPTLHHFKNSPNYFGSIYRIFRRTQGSSFLFLLVSTHTKITSSFEDVIFVVIICYLGERYEEIFLSSLKTLII